jgi:hypothetical protein
MKAQRQSTNLSVRERAVYDLIVLPEAILTEFQYLIERAGKTGNIETGYDGLLSCSY